MAKKKKAASSTVAPAVRAEELPRKIEDAIEQIGGDEWSGTPYGKQLKVVEDLESKLAIEREKLECLAAPMRKVWDLLNSEELSKLATKQPYDDALKSCCSRIKLQYKNYGSKKPLKTGAVHWNVLRKDGATDEQIVKNLDSFLAGSYNNSVEAGDYKLYVGRGFSLERIDKLNARRDVTVISGKAAIIAEVRRVMGIPQPTAAAKKPAAKPKSPSKPAAGKAPQTAAKKPATSKKKSAGKKPAPGGVAAFLERKAASQNGAKSKKPQSPAPSSQPHANGHANGNAVAAVGGKAPRFAVPPEEEPTASCAMCGCTEDDPCVGGCYWVDDPLALGRNICSNEKCIAAAERGADGKPASASAVYVEKVLARAKGGKLPQASPAKRVVK